MQRLNYHHLHYFWSVAKVGKLTKAAEMLNVSQSALSTQIKLLEDVLGTALFKREGRELSLTEAGHIALAYADDIFHRGEELTALLQHGHLPDRKFVRIGALATLSRNFQETFISPLLNRSDVQLFVQSGRLRDLLTSLSTFSLDIVLSNVPVRGDDEQSWRCRRIARQQVSVIGKPRKGRKRFDIPEDLSSASLIVPGPASDIRRAFDMLCEKWQLLPRIRAEVDDMAMMRLLVRDSDSLAVMPAVVVRDEIKSGILKEYHPLQGVYENFYAITMKGRFQADLISELMDRSESEFFKQ
jgi:LysR family transcriptional activator of nhaA